MTTPEEQAQEALDKDFDVMINWARQHGKTALLERLERYAARDWCELPDCGCNGERHSM